MLNFEITKISLSIRKVLADDIIQVGHTESVKEIDIPEVHTMIRWRPAAAYVLFFVFLAPKASKCDEFTYPTLESPAVT